MASELQGTETALRRQITKRVQNAAYNVPSFMGLFLGLDNFYNKRAKGHTRFDREGINGGNLQVDWFTSMPTVRGTNALNPDYTARQIPVVKNVQRRAGQVAASAYEGAEPVDKYEENRLVNDKALTNYVSKVSSLFSDAIATTINEHAWPTENQYGGMQTYMPALDHIMGLAAPLQNGYLLNNSAGTLATSYNYMGVDLNAGANVNLKAYNIGHTASSVTPSVSNIRKAMGKVRDQGGMVDLIVMGSADFEYCATTADATIQQPGYKDEINLGVEYFKIGSAFVVREPRIDLMTYKEIYLLDTRSWVFAMRPDAMRDIDLITKVPGAPSYSLLQFYTEFVLICTMPKWNGRIFNTVVP